MRNLRLDRLLWLLLVVMLLALAASLAGAQDSGGRVCVTAFHDDNRNGARDAIEPLLPEVVIHLQNAQNVVIANYLTTGVSEPYCFSGLAAGAYTVSFFPGSNWTPTRQDSLAVTLAAGQTVPAQVQFGAVPAPQETTGATTPSSAASSADDDTLLRVALSLGGAALAVFVMSFLGLLIYFTRFRR